MQAPNDVDRWKPTGVIYLWRYLENERNFPGWHFAVDAAAVGSLSILLGAMVKADQLSVRTLPVSEPTKSLLTIPNNRAAKWRSPAKVRVKFCPADSTAWSFDDSEVLEWSLGKEHAERIAEVFLYPAKYVDQSVGKNPPLWSWGVFSE